MMNHRPISFPDWKYYLEHAALGASVKADYKREIIAFLRYCKTTHAGATVDLARHYLSTREQSAPGQAREALRWFYRGAQSSERTKRTHPPAAVSFPVQAADVGNFPAVGPKSDVPPLAARDLGGPEWERALIKASRERGFLWKTEKTYREWAIRFARFLQPRSPLVAGPDEVAAFLSALAVEHRASASSQKQALNAVVFLLQEALHRELGEFEFRRGQARRRMPTILSIPECRSLFAQLDGTPRLMAELAYGAGLRLTELLRLRVHHLDVSRGRLQIFGGKGDKDRVSILPQKLVPALRERLAHLHSLWERDRAQALAGVWLPEGLNRKYPNAGISWEWPRKGLRQRG